MVTGASRGAGLGIATALGQHGCTVYVTGRTERSESAEPPGTIHATAEAVTAAGGKGIAIRCDHGDDENVAALFAQIAAEQGRLDILVNNAAAIRDELTQPGEFWEKPLAMADLITVGIRSSYVATYYAAPLLAAARRGLVVFTSASGARHYALGPAYGAHKAAMDKMAFDMAADFAHAGTHVAALSIWMGALLTDRLKAIIAADPGKYGTLAQRSEAPELTGHVVWGLFNDPALMEKSGQTLVGAEAARAYGITDADGRQPPTTGELHGFSPIPYEALVIR